MTRNEFMRRLKKGLRCLPAEELAEVLADYDAHFDAGLADGRSEEEVAEALGEPGRLARETRLEAGIRQWEEGRSPSSAWAAVAGLLGLATIDILILLPVIFVVAVVIAALFVADFAVLVAGSAIMIAGPFSGFPGGALVALLTGLGLAAGSIAAGAILIIVTIWFVNALIWFGRLHYRVIEPAISPEV